MSETDRETTRRIETLETATVPCSGLCDRVDALEGILAEALDLIGELSAGGVVGGKYGFFEGSGYAHAAKMLRQRLNVATAGYAPGELAMQRGTVSGDTK